MSLSENRFPLSGHAPTPAQPRRRPPCRPPTIRRALRASAAAEHDHGLGTKNVGDCCWSETVPAGAASGAQLGRDARITLRERSRHWQPNGYGSAGQAETTGRGSGLAERTSGLTTRRASRSPLGAAGTTSGVISGATSPLTSAAGLGLLSGVTSAVTCGTASAPTSDLPPASAVTTAALNAKAARAAATLYRDIR